MNSLRKSISIVLFFVLLLSNLSIQGQIEFPTSQAIESDSALHNRIEAIPLNLVPAKIEETEEIIKLGEKKIVLKKSILEIDSLFPLYVDFLKINKKNATIFIKANPNRQKIDNLISKWDSYYDHLNKWQSVINNIQDNNIDLIIPVKENEVLWSKTYDLAKSEKAPASILNTIQRTIKDIQRIKKAIVDENNKLLTLETEITKNKGFITVTIDDLNNLKNSSIYNVFYRRHDTFWNLKFSKEGGAIDEKQGVESIANNFKTSSDYFKNNVGDFIKYSLLIGLLILFFILFKKAFREVKFTEQDAQLQQAKSIIMDHTISGIIFISGIIAIFFFTALPFLISNIILLITLISSIPIIQSVLFNRFNKLPYFIILFHLINIAKTFIWFTTTNYRIYILIESILVVIILLYFTHPFWEIRKIKSNNFGKFLINLVPVFYVLLLISIISNLLGYTNLTDLSLKVATQSSILTMLFYGILMIASGLLIGGIHLFFTKQSVYNERRKLYVEKRSLQFLRAFIFIWWFFYFLNLIDLQESFILWISESLISPHNFGSVSFTYAEILTFILILTVSFLITNFISMIVDGGALKFLKLPKGIPTAVSLVVRYFILIFAFILALSSLGIDMSNFNLMAGALGLGIGFGLQTIISNFISGIILIFERPILLGDTVEVQNLLGKVTNIGVRASKIRTFDGAEVIVPNNNLISNDLINWTLSDSVKRLEIKIGAAYGTDPNLVLKILKEEAKKDAFTLKDPLPNALFDKFGDSSLDFRLLVWVPYDKGLESKSSISVGIYNSFKKHGVEIPFPQQDVYIKQVSEFQTNTPGKKETIKSKNPSDENDKKEN